MLFRIVLFFKMYACNLHYAECFFFKLTCMISECIFLSLPCFEITTSKKSLKSIFLHNTNVRLFSFYFLLEGMCKNAIKGLVIIYQGGVGRCNSKF